MSALCRGCGGTGLDHSLTPREIQAVRGIFYMRKASEFNAVRSNQVVSLEICSIEFLKRARCEGAGPLAHVLERMEHYASLGFVEPERDPDELRKMACSWCHGTGVPQLSAAYMERAMAVSANA